MNVFRRKYSMLFVRALLTCCVLIVVADAVDACPTCKQALAENDPQQQSLVSGYFYSILFMMGMPFAILGTLGGLAFVSIRRAANNEPVAEVRAVEHVEENAPAS